MARVIHQGYFRFRQQGADRVGCLVVRQVSHALLYVVYRVIHSVIHLGFTLIWLLHYLSNSA